MDGPNRGSGEERRGRRRPILTLQGWPVHQHLRLHGGDLEAARAHGAQGAEVHHGGAELGREGAPLHPLGVGFDGQPRGLGGPPPMAPPPGLAQLAQLAQLGAGALALHCTHSHPHSHTPTPTLVGFGEGGIERTARTQHARLALALVGRQLVARSAAAGGSGPWRPGRAEPTRAVGAEEGRTSLPSGGARCR